MKKEKQKWKMWAVQYKTTPYFIPIRFFSTRQEATAFAADHMQDWIVFKVTVTRGWDAE